MPELAEALIQEHDMRAAPAELSRFLKHRLGYTYKKILDCNGEAAQAGALPRDTSGGTEPKPRMRLEPHRLVFIPSRQIALQSPAGRGTKRR